MVLTYGVLKTTVSIEVKRKDALNGTGAASDPYVIDTAEGLQALAEKTNGGRNFRGEYFVLTADIDLSGIENWPGIGKDGAQFQRKLRWTGPCDQRAQHHRRL